MAHEVSTTGKITNFVMFQLVWFAVVLGAAEGLAWYGVAFTSSWLAVHVWLAARSGREAATIAMVTVAGFAVDQLSTALGVQEFDDRATRVGFVPVWIACLWAGFATTLRSSLGWMRGRYALGAALGAVVGPLAYLGAERLGAITLGEPRWVSFAGLGIEWAAMMPFALWAARKDPRAPEGPGTRGSGA